MTLIAQYFEPLLQIWANHQARERIDVAVLVDHGPSPGRVVTAQALVYLDRPVNFSDEVILSHFFRSLRFEYVIGVGLSEPLQAKEILDNLKILSQHALFVAFAIEVHQGGSAPRRLLISQSFHMLDPQLNFANGYFSRRRQ